jgi:hypothetical protein
MGKDINESKLIGGKRKNGHKLECTCHICENMKNKARRGGYQEEVEKQQERMMGGSKKKNGHRKDCECPICKNMKNSKKNGGSKSVRKTKKFRGGDDGEENIENEVIVESGPDNTSDNDTIGGKKKKGNGHKPNCKCPICNNMRKKKGGSLEDELGDIEEGGIKSSMSESETKELETKATDEDYDALEAAEKGEAGVNIVGGTRKRRAGKKWRGKKRSKTRKMRKYR